MRLGVYLGILGLASWLLPQIVTAAETAPVYFDAALVRWGKTLVLGDGAKAGIFPQALTKPANVTWTKYEGTVPALPPNRALLGNVYRLSIEAPLNAEASRWMAVAIPFGSSNWIRQVWVYDLDAKQWNPLPISLNSDHTLGQAPSGIQRGLYAILEDRHQLEGTASYYCINQCSPSAGQMIAATNAFPIGTKLRVKNLHNGQTITVEIVSTWSGTSRHLIDLHLSAFAALGGTTSQGIIPVNIQPATAPQVLGVSTGYDPNAKIEVIPNLRLVGNNGIPFPTIRPRPFAVFDQTTGQLLAMHRKDDVVPIASITKLMTAAVFLDTKTDLKKIITYQAEDQTPYGYLRVAPGETMYVRDLFYATLVGSANNAATALARSTGLSRDEFVAKMNAKAKAWGLGQTRFVDVHGLDARNVSSAEELARMAAQIFHEYEPVRFVTVKREYSFTTLNTGVPHRLVTTDKLLGSGLVDSSLVVTGGKTGYIDEAKYTYVFRAAAKDNGRQVVAVILGSASSSERFNDAAAVMNWAYRNHQWAP